MEEKVSIRIALKSIATALEQIHVLGRDSELLCGAIKALRNVIEALEKARKEAEQSDCNNEQGTDV